MNYNLMNEDCIIGMAKIASGSVDLILTDLPYGITDASFDNRVPLKPMWKQFLRVTKENAAIILFSQMPFGAELIMSQRKLFRYEWIWRKALAVGFLNAKKMPLRIHENILVFYRKLPTYNPQYWYSTPYKAKKGSPTKNYRTLTQNSHSSSEDGQRYPLDVLNYPQPICGAHKETFHPQQKPTALLEYLIKTYSNKDETVLDATMGSGSTGVACMNTGRNFIGFELDTGYYEVAKGRIEKADARHRDLVLGWHNV